MARHQQDIYAVADPLFGPAQRVTWQTTARQRRINRQGWGAHRPGAIQIRQQQIDTGRFAVEPPMGFWLTLGSHLGNDRP